MIRILALFASFIFFATAVTMRLNDLNARVAALEQDRLHAASFYVSRHWCGTMTTIALENGDQTEVCLP